MLWSPLTGNKAAEGPLPVPRALSLHHPQPWDVKICLKRWCANRWSDAGEVVTMATYEGCKLRGPQSNYLIKGLLGLRETEVRVCEGPTAGVFIYLFVCFFICCWTQTSVCTSLRWKFNKTSSPFKKQFLLISICDDRNCWWSLSFITNICYDFYLIFNITSTLYNKKYNV